METLNLFPDLVVDAPPTEGVKYIGSKLKLLPHIIQLVRRVNPRTVLDGFSGTTRVSQALAQIGCSVVANDLAIWSKIFGTCYLLNPHPPAHYKPFIDHLNSLSGTNGWFTEHYGAEASRDGPVKRPWQRHNTRKLDAIREEIEHLTTTPVERAVLLTSLMLAMDEVDSTIGHFVSYLGAWSHRSYNKVHLRVPRLIQSAGQHSVHQGDIFELAPTADVDLAYFDPPYGSNNEKMPPSRVRYAAYYHLWTSVCLNDRPPLFGKANRREDSSDRVAGSPFEDFRRGITGRFIVIEAVERLLRETRAKHIILSYSSGGRATAEELSAAIASVGELLEVLEIDHKRNVMAQMRWTNEWINDAQEKNTEFLFLMRKR